MSDYADPERYGEHETARAVLQHVATVDHDAEVPMRLGILARLRELAEDDRALWHALAELRPVEVVQVYCDTRRDLEARDEDGETEWRRV